MNVATSTAASNPIRVEDKHTKFLRLIQTRVGRALDDLRLVGQLSARTYEHKPHEAEEVVQVLDQAVKEVATSFAVPYTTKVGRAGRADNSTIIGAVKTTPMVDASKTKLAIVKALELLEQDKVHAAKEILVELI